MPNVRRSLPHPPQRLQRSPPPPPHPPPRPLPQPPPRTHPTHSHPDPNPPPIPATYQPTGIPTPNPTPTTSQPTNPTPLPGHRPTASLPPLPTIRRPSSTPPTLSTSLTSIRHHVRAAATEISHLNASPSTSGSANREIADVKRRLKDAHRGLEKLEEEFAFIGEIKREVWKTYRRLREWEEEMKVVRVGRGAGSEEAGRGFVAGRVGEWEGRGSRDRMGEERGDVEERWEERREGQEGERLGEGELVHVGDVEETWAPDVVVTRPEFGRSGSAKRVVRAIPAVQTTSVMGRPEYDRVASVVEGSEGAPTRPPTRGEDEGRRGGDRRSFPMRGIELKKEDEEFLTLPDTVTIRRPRAKTAAARMGERWPDARVMVPKVVPVAPPVARRATTRKGYSDSPKPHVVAFPANLPRTRKEVLKSIAWEEGRAGPTLNDFAWKRQGSAESWIVTQAVMTANSDSRVCIPHPAYIKIHEVRDLKSWLSRHRYLRRSRGMSKTEKILHLLTLLQVGCRFESVAVLFSRSPREVLSACKEAFEGMLEMHSETMVPDRRIAKRYYYPDLWHIVHNYDIEHDEPSHQQYCPWKREDIFKVILTLNCYIGRYRRQGRFALDGDYMDWGRYIDVGHDEAVFDVPHWIERLQISPSASDASTRQDAPG